MELRRVLALNVRKRRRTLGLTQEELAFRAEIDRTYVSAIERSVYAVTIDVLEKLSEALNVEPGDLLRTNPPRQ